MLRGMRNLDVIGSQRRAMAKTHLVDIRRWDREIKTNKALISKAVATSGTTVTDIYGVGPVVAAFLIGYTGGHRPVRHRRLRYVGRQSNTGSVLGGCSSGGWHRRQSTLDANQP